MKRLLLTIGFCFFLAFGALAQTTIAFQDFESGSDDWDYTLDPASFNFNGDIWAIVTSLGSITPTSGSSFFGVQDLENDSLGTSGFGKIEFDYYDVSGQPNLEISFDYDVDGFDSNDDVWYVVYENTTQADSIQLIDGFSNFSDSGTVNYTVSATDSVKLIIYVSQNGASDQGGFDNFKITSSALKAEPTNHPTSFVATSDGFSEIDLSWIDATGAVVPDGYLIKVSDVSLGSITDPVDGTSEVDDSDVSDGSGVVNINQGTQSASFTGLNDNTQYFFKIYSYTNSGADIDYKINGTIQSDDATTDPFDSDIVISQYVDTGSGTAPKGIEIWNVSGGTIDFSATNLVVNRYSNGSTSASVEATINSGTLADQGVLVIGGDSLSLYMSTNHPSVTFENDGFSFNGNDALELTLDGIRQDIFGTIGTDPGSAWSGSGVSTADMNISLQVGISEGSSTGFSDPSTRFQSEDNSIANTGDLRGFGIAPGELLISGDEGWRLLSLPKTGGTVSDISDDTAIQGVTGGSDPDSTNNIFTYDESGDFEAPTNVSTTIGDGHGIGVYFFDNTLNGSNELPLVLDVSGIEPSSDVSVDLNVSTLETGSYFTMLGNPFASNFDLSTITATGGSIHANVHFWDNGASSYLPQDRTTPFIVEPWQGFWVESTDGATSISIPTSGKTTSATNGTYFSKENPNRADINFRLSSANTNDKAIRLSFRDNAIVGYDVDDASKLDPLVSNYATMAFIGELNEVEKLQSVFSLPYTLSNEITIPMRVKNVNTSGEFTFSWETLENLPSGMSATLFDYETGASVNMNEVTSYTFDLDASKTKETRTILAVRAAQSNDEGAASRFGISISPNTSVSNEPEDKPTEFSLEQNYPNPFNPSTTIKYAVAENGPVNITIYNVMGQKVSELLNTTKNSGTYQITWDASGVSSGIYYYRLTTPSKVLTLQMTLIK